MHRVARPIQHISAEVALPGAGVAAPAKVAAGARPMQVAQYRGRFNPTPARAMKAEAASQRTAATSVKSATADGTPK